MSIIISIFWVGVRWGKRMTLKSSSSKTRPMIRRRWISEKKNWTELVSACQLPVPLFLTNEDC
jgi:hypothetical protein